MKVILFWQLNLFNALHGFAFMKHFNSSIREWSVENIPFSRSLPLFYFFPTNTLLQLMISTYTTPQNSPIFLPYNSNISIFKLKKNLAVTIYDSYSYDWYNG